MDVLVGMGFPAAHATAALAAAGNDVHEAMELILSGVIPATGAAAAPPAGGGGAESVDLVSDDDSDPSLLSAPATAEKSEAKPKPKPKPKPKAKAKAKAKPAASPVLQRGAASPANKRPSTGKGKEVERVEESANARAACKACKVKIAKAELRVGTVLATQWGESTGWYHAECFPFGAGKGWQHKQPRATTRFAKDFLDRLRVLYQTPRSCRATARCPPPRSSACATRSAATCRRGRSHRQLRPPLLLRRQRLPRQHRSPLASQG